MGSPVHLNKIIANLTINAFAAIPSGGDIEVKTDKGLFDFPQSDNSSIQGSMSCVVLKIKDTGQGISPENQKRIFEPFFTNKQMDNGGSGLGMAVVWGAVQDHNSHIDIKSRLGAGTEFTLYFPTEPPALMVP